MKVTTPRLHFVKNVLLCIVAPHLTRCRVHKEAVLIQAMPASLPIVHRSRIDLTFFVTFPVESVLVLLSASTGCDSAAPAAEIGRAHV